MKTESYTDSIIQYYEFLKQLLKWGKSFYK